MVKISSGGRRPERVRPGFGVRSAADLQRSVDGAIPQALVVVPTRELCVQAVKDLELAGRQGDACSLSTAVAPTNPQVDALKRASTSSSVRRVDSMDPARQRKLRSCRASRSPFWTKQTRCRHGLPCPTLRQSSPCLPAERQTLLFSATMPGQIVNLARRYMTRPTHIRASDPNEDNITVDAVEQHVWRARHGQAGDRCASCRPKVVDSRSSSVARSAPPRSSAMT